MINQSFQLQQEEKWLLEAIRTVRTQRNALHIERLHIESLRHQAARTHVPVTNRIQTGPKLPESAEMEVDMTDLEQTLKNFIQGVNDQPNHNELSEFREGLHINQANLNLAVNKKQYDQFLEEETEDDTEDDDDLFVDMDNLINRELVGSKTKDLDAQGLPKQR